MFQLLSFVGFVVVLSVAILVAVHVRDRRRVRRIVALLQTAAAARMSLDEAQIHLHGEIASTLFVRSGQIVVQLRRRGSTLDAAVLYVGDASDALLVDIVVLERHIRAALGAATTFRFNVNHVLGGRA